MKSILVGRYTTVKIRYDNTHPKISKNILIQIFKINRIALVYFLQQVKLLSTLLFKYFAKKSVHV